MGSNETSAFGASILGARMMGNRWCGVLQVALQRRWPRGSAGGDSHRYGRSIASLPH